MKSTKMLIPAMAVSLLTGLTLTSALAAPQGDGAGKRAPQARPQAQIDANNDGVITRDEFGQRAVAHFVLLDTDKDGKVTPAEAEAAIAALKEKAQQHKGEFFTQMDKNADGVLTLDETPEKADGLFARLDTDNDGKVTKAEAEAAMAKMREQVATHDGMFFNHFDVNKDGAITLDEIKTRQDDIFTKLDANGDGKLTKDEVKATAIKAGERIREKVRERQQGK